MRTKALKNLGGKGAWAYPGTAEIFLVPPIIRKGQSYEHPILYADS